MLCIGPYTGIHGISLGEMCGQTQFGDCGFLPVLKLIKYNAIHSPSLLLPPTTLLPIHRVMLLLCSNPLYATYSSPTKHSPPGFWDLQAPPSPCNGVFHDATVIPLYELTIIIEPVPLCGLSLILLPYILSRIPNFVSPGRNALPNPLHMYLHKTPQTTPFHHHNQQLKQRT